ncbi:MAG: glycosyl hydrolase family 5 [Burkholderiales bacterium]|nr:glycosyl hydrolase family 5 [Burkholderiales bacterium]
MVTACAADSDWQQFTKAFVEADGRVVDTGQGRISHSEGQGFAMLFAVHYDDRAAFDRLWQWTRRNLQVRDDALLAWKWEAQAGVTDRNNASDADVLVAWALVRAARKWRHPEYEAAGRRIAQDVRQKLLRRVPHGLVLLPAVEGFDKPEGMTINLSYWVFPAFRELARADPAPEWEELSKSGIAILQYSYFGRWRLPPDWLKLGERVAPGGPPPERFGYDAVRIPVYLLWSRQETDALMKPYRDFWGHFAGARDPPAWTNLKDDSVDSHGASTGIRAIAQVVAEYPRVAASRLPPLDAGQSYYSAVLLLLTKLALRERGEG